MINFLKSLVLPSYMARYRHISVLLSICILVLTCYLFSLPVGNYYLKNSEQFLTSEEAFVLALTKVPDDNIEANNIAADLKEMGLAMDDANSITVNESLGDNYIYSNKFEYDITVNTVDKDGNLVKEDDVQVTHVEHVVMNFVVYFDSEKSFYDSDLYKNFNNQPLKIDSEGNLEEHQYLIAILKSSVVYQIGQIIEINDENKDSYSDEEEAIYKKSVISNMPLTSQILFTTLKFEPSRFTNVGSSVTMEIARLLSINSTSTYYMMYVLFQLLSSCILFPLLIVLLFWLFFKKNGKLKTFREYLNIAAFSAIIPAIIVFIVAWFYVSVIDFYVYPFAIFFLFNVYRINSTPELV